MLDELQPYFDYFNKTNKEKIEKSYAFYRNIITILVGFIAVLVSLKSNVINPNTHLIKILFTTTISLMSLGILVGIILLNEEVSDLGRVENQLEEYIKSRLSGKGKDKHLLISTPYSKIYKSCKFIFIGSLISALIILTIYSYLV